MSDELCELLAQYPDSQRLAISVGDEGVPIGLNVGELTVLLARSDALHASQARLSEAMKVLEPLLEQAEHVCIGAHTPADIRLSARNLHPLILAAKAFITTLGGEK